MEPESVRDGDAPAAKALARQDGYVVAEGESAAQAISRFYKYAVPRIVAVLVSTAGATVDEASEAAHLALVEAAQSWSAIHSNPLSWCITVARRHWGRRKYNAETSYEDIPPASPLMRAHNQDVVRRVEARLRLDETISRLPLLTSRERKVLDLHLAGLASWEIGKYLGLAEPTVRVHLANARRRLDGEVTTDGGDEG